ncbi:hypothetical protein PCANC_02184 [Puccinia coronata f. sp. avenae]|uniref:Uncharacterized protein n=1 Tax=Puccinia coronata f. sp. avenae TaxID=200324 RepID=A0A2N5W100_9BASI|nr:hypothetical protein PCANC_02184 [Puccinia coronata f. sp. avenae]
MQQPIPDHAPEHNPSTLELIKSLPTDIQFYLVLKQEKGFLVDAFKAKVTALLSAYCKFPESDESNAHAIVNAEMYDEAYCGTSMSAFCRREASILPHSPKPVPAPFSQDVTYVTALAYEQTSQSSWDRGPLIMPRNI